MGIPAGDDGCTVAKSTPRRWCAGSYTNMGLTSFCFCTADSAPAPTPNPKPERYTSLLKICIRPAAQLQLRQYGFKSRKLRGLRIISRIIRLYVKNVHSWRSLSLSLSLSFSLYISLSLSLSLHISFSLSLSLSLSTYLFLSLCLSLYISLFFSLSLSLALSLSLSLSLHFSFSFSLSLYIYIQNHMGGCQNYGPFLGPYYNTAPNI